MSKLVLLALLALAVVFVTRVEARTEPADLAALKAFRDSFQVFKPNWPLETIDPCDNLPLYKFTITCLPPTQPHFPLRVGKISLDCYGLRGTLPSVLRNFTALRILDLGNNYLSGNVSESIFPARLQYINLFNNSFEGPVPTFSNLTDLLEVYLAKNKFSGRIPAVFGQNFSLRVLSLNSNNLTGTVPPTLGSYRNLTQLFLANNTLNGTISTSLGNLSSLVILSLWKNGLTGGIPTQLGGLSKLRFLYLDRNQLTGSIPSQLGQLRDLRILYLRENRLVGTIPSQLGQLSNLTALSLAVNNLTGSIPLEIGNIPRLALLHIYLNRNLRGTIPFTLAFSSVLNDLDLSSNALSGTIPQEFSNLLNRPSFRRLKLSWNDLSGNLTDSIFRVKPFNASVDISQNPWLCNSLPEWCGPRGDKSCDTVKCVLPTTAAPTTRPANTTSVNTTRSFVLSNKKRSEQDVESLTLNWVSSVTDDENASVNYEAEMAEEDSDNYSIVYRGKAPMATVQGLHKGKQYQFRIRAVHDGIVGPWSDAIKATVQ
eukprot:TRINITY_DN2160_c0_g1_i1.p1 TRINITY_DN2160_c0_g1~~TRINITY_DN2160_c0_g1_i1.p1  ORF type:complete len:541 (-),score=114.42 TRINITY_DN2160_c0_g1_i1:162-1784(-)